MIYPIVEVWRNAYCHRLECAVVPERERERDRETYTPTLKNYSEAIFNGDILLSDCYKMRRAGQEGGGSKIQNSSHPALEDNKIDSTAATSTTSRPLRLRFIFRSFSIGLSFYPVRIPSAVY